MSTCRGLAQTSGAWEEWPAGDGQGTDRGTDGGKDTVRMVKGAGLVVPPPRLQVAEAWECMFLPSLLTHPFPGNPALP